MRPASFFGGQKLPLKSDGDASLVSAMLIRAVRRADEKLVGRSLMPVDDHRAEPINDADNLTEGYMIVIGRLPCLGVPRLRRHRAYPSVLRIP